MRVGGAGCAGGIFRDGAVRKKKHRKARILEVFRRGAAGIVFFNDAHRVHRLAALGVEPGRDHLFGGFHAGVRVCRAVRGVSAARARAEAEQGGKYKKLLSAAAFPTAHYVDFVCRDRRVVCGNEFFGGARDRVFGDHYRVFGFERERGIVRGEHGGSGTGEKRLVKKILIFFNKFC